tara:strand:+ start:286 stop:459 length:174 start_codon:yes stop_codon:yes gene_type:complete
MSQVIPDVVVTIAIKKMSDQTTIKVRRVKKPVADWESQIHVLFHHNGVAMVGRMMPT